jgi:hypothetical protein
MNSSQLNYDFLQFSEIVEFVNQPESLFIDLLKNNSGLKIIFFGKEEYVESIRNSLDIEIRQRCEFIHADIFSSLLPSGYKLYILKDIIDYQNENQSVDFLNRCFQASETYDRFLLIESGKYDGLDDVTKYNMVKECYSSIFKQSGFILTNIINSGHGTDIIEILRK